MVSLSKLLGVITCSKYQSSTHIKFVSLILVRLIKNCRLCINIVGTKRWYGNGMLFDCKCDTAMLTDGDNVRVTVPRWLARRIHRCMITSLTYNNTSMTADQASYKPTTGNIIMLSTLLINHISCCFIKNRKVSHSPSPGCGW